MTAPGWTELRFSPRHMSHIEFKMFSFCGRHGFFRLLGIPWKEKIEWTTDVATGDILVRYK